MPASLGGTKHSLRAMFKLLWERGIEKVMVPGTRGPCWRNGSPKYLQRIPDQIKLEEYAARKQNIYYALTAL